MLARLFVLFTALPLVEFFLLVQVEKVIGIVATVLLILATGSLGALLAQREGLRTLREFREQTVRGGPTRAIVEGVLVLVAGAVLLTPGILTDAFGFALLVPAVRKRLAPLLIERGKRSVKARVAKQAEQMKAAFAEASRQGAPANRSDVIDVEFEEKPPERTLDGPAA